MQEIGCAQIWGGVRGKDADVQGSGFIASVYSRAAEGAKGGDIYYLSVCSGGAITRIALADVRGHGESVSETSQWLYEALQTRVNELDGSDLMTDLNALVGQRGYEAMTTATIVSFLRAESNLHFTYAGHPPMFVYRQDDARWDSVMLGSPRRCANLPLGAFGNTSYDDEVRPIAVGDRIFLYTDGLIEATNSDGKPFGLDGVARALEEAAGGTVRDIKHAVLDALSEHSNGAASDDDVTFMVVEVH